MRHLFRHVCLDAYLISRCKVIRRGDHHQSPYPHHGSRLWLNSLALFDWDIRGSLSVLVLIWSATQIITVHTPLVQAASPLLPQVLYPPQSHLAPCHLSLYLKLLDRLHLGLPWSVRSLGLPTSSLCLR